MSLSLLGLVLLQAPYVRTHDREIRTLPVAGTPSVPGAAEGRPRAYPPVCNALAAGRHGESVPGGGTLNPIAFVNPATIGAPDVGPARSAFVAEVSGAARNQGVFVHDGAALTPIALGCGGLGGSGVTGACGSPTPLGGTFTGFFTGTVFAPAVNADGDVLFMADVRNGSAPRGLFFFDASLGSLVSVAAVGGLSPLGGVFAIVGPGSVNDAGQVAFLASAGATGESDVFLWEAGVTIKVAAAGDAAPLGSVYAFLGTESFGFADGSTIPVGPVPDVDAAGNVVFRAITAAGRRGLVRRTSGGSASWVVQDLEPTPAGGTFLDFQGASANAAGEVAFFADVRLSATEFTSGWFAGTSGSWRKVLAFGDAVGGGTCNGLAFSRNPMSTLDDAGNVIVWTDVLLTGGGSREHVVVGAPDGTLASVARNGDPTPLGGTYGTFDAWPSLAADGRGTLSGTAPGSGVLSAHFLFEPCATASAVVRNGTGVNATCFLAAPPVLGTPWTASVDARAHPGATLTAILGRVRPLPGVAVPAGELLIDLASPRCFLSVVPGNGLVAHGGSIPADASLAGIACALQGLILGAGFELCNAVDVVLGY